jgi:hypothetical protein
LAKEDSLVAIRAQLTAKTLPKIYQAVDEVAEKIIGLTIRRIKVRVSVADSDLPEDLYVQKRNWLVVAGVIKEVLEEKTGLHDALLGGSGGGGCSFEEVEKFAFQQPPHTATSTN